VVSRKRLKCSTFASGCSSPIPVSLKNHSKGGTTYHNQLPKFLSLYRHPRLDELVYLYQRQPCEAYYHTSNYICDVEDLTRLVMAKISQVLGLFSPKRSFSDYAILATNDFEI
jgi:hypothetical protein